MNELFNNIFEQYAIYAIKEINPNFSIFDYNFQKICSNLDMSQWYNLLKVKSLPELEIILQALLQSNYNFLNSDPLHSEIVLDLKRKIEQKLYSLDVEDLKTKIKPYPITIGYLAADFDYKKNRDIDMKEFCLASFVYIIHEQNCKNWLAKLKYYVKEIKLTKLYVYGRDIASVIRNSLDIDVICIRLYRNKPLECCRECNKKVCTIRQIKFYFRKFHSFYINYDCH